MAFGVGDRLACLHWDGMDWLGLAWLGENLLAGAWYLAEVYMVWCGVMG
jgi:hypothetical protein